MSLRARIVLLFAAALILTLGVAAYLGERIAQQAIERSLRERTVELARTIAEELALSPRSDPARAARQLGAILTRRRGLRSAQLLIRQGAEMRVVHVTFGPEGAVVDARTERSVALPVDIGVALVEEGATRAWRVDLPLRDAAHRPYGALRLEASLSQAEEIATTERNVFFLVAGVGATLLALGFTIALGRMVTSPLGELAAAMSAVESGAIEAVRIPGTARGDEIGSLARGLAAMLERIRRFSGELQGTVDAAVADLARKNRELEEVNHLLVEARHDLTSKERLAALGQLSGTIAHELGNPLNAISGHVQLLARDPASPPDVRAGLEIVEREVKRITTSLRRFLDSARTLAPEPEEVDLAGLVDEVLTLSIPADARSRLRVQVEIEPDARRVRADPTLVRHVLGNLVSNAVDAMPGGGALAVRAARRDGGIAIAVADTGAGLGPEERKRVFEPFYTTKPRGKGTGLGLAISREIATALRGRIELESAPGDGSTFTLVFPETSDPTLSAGGANGTLAHSRRR